MINLCQLENLSCFGCCGRDYKRINLIKKDIEKNTQDFNKYDDLIKFRDRAHKWDLRNSGVCRNVIEKEERIFCPLHPTLNKGKDLREGHCEINHLCDTYKEFMDWDKDKKEKFIQFILSKELDNYRYSLLMDSGYLLNEFKEINKL